MNKQENLQVSIWRGDDTHGQYHDYLVPAGQNQTVLDIVSWLQQNIIPDLAYRFACRVGVCGSCAMTINGTPRWTCRTHIKNASKNGKIRIAPLTNLPIIRDLVVNMDPFFDKWIAAGGYHQPSKSRDDKIALIDPHSKSRKRADAGIECINCAVCYAACDTVKNNPKYLGPAALQRAWSSFNDERHDNPHDISHRVSSQDGCFNCHGIGSCSALCPIGLNPLHAITQFKRTRISDKQA